MDFDSFMLKRVFWLLAHDVMRISQNIEPNTRNILCTPHIAAFTVPLKTSMQEVLFNPVVCIESQQVLKMIAQYKRVLTKKIFFYWYIGY